MNNELIKEAAESVACSHIERYGLSPENEQDRDCVLDAVARAFQSDPIDTRKAALDFAEYWLDTCQEVSA